MDGIEWASSAMVAARTRLEIATGNLANVSTDGFKKAVARGVLTAGGVEIDRQISAQHGALRPTGQPFDLAIVGNGCFRVRDAHGTVTGTRNGNFTRDVNGCLRDSAGRALLGLHGAVRVPDGATIDERGRVMLAGRQIDRIPIDPGATIRSGFIECANVDAIGEMVTVLAAQRSFESAEKVVSAIDGTRQKAANDVARVK
jgi:flagellar basal-body rod protein FlgG